MRYTSALVLSTLAIGQAVAHKGRHASFHARRHAEEKRDEMKYDDPNWTKSVDWDKLTYDLTSVDWSSVFNKNPAPTPTPEAKPAVANVEVAQVEKPETTSTTSSSSSSSSSSTSSQSSTTTEEAAKPTQTKSSSSSSSGDLAEGCFDGLDEWASKLGIAGFEAQAASTVQKLKTTLKLGEDSSVWLGKSQYEANFYNDGSKDALLACWKHEGYSFTVNTVIPAVLIKLSPGLNQTVSFTKGLGSACAPIFEGQELSKIFGGIGNVWFEATYGSSGATFDVSYNNNMHGDNMSIQGKSCKSDKQTCVYKCTSGDSCETGYDLLNCGSYNGGHRDWDPGMQGWAGGCLMDQSGESLTVRFSNN